MATRQLLVGILALFLVNQSTATPVSAPKYAQVGLDTRDMKRKYIYQDVEAWVEHHLGPWLTDRPRSPQFRR